MQGTPPVPAEKRVADLHMSLRAIRNDLVHSQLRFAPLDGKLHAIVINAQDMNKAARASRVLALEDFKKLASQIAEIKRSVG